MLPRERIFGLDLLRATAVLLVIFHHSLLFMRAPKALYSFYWLGEIGVGALLLLSGYLIGRGLIQKTREGRFFQFRHLGEFYLRRWTRTLPPYYVYLLIMAALFPPFLPQLLRHWDYFLFLQNFAWNMPLFYSQTWTLALLEFFYLLFPLLLYLASKFVRNHLICLAVPMVLLFGIPVLLRIAHGPISTAAELENTFRTWIVYRLDTPIIGVAAALVQAELPLLWAWFLHRTWIGLTTFCAILAYHFLHCPWLYSSHWLQVIFYPLSALALAPLLPCLCHWKFNRSLLGTALSSISQVSYSLYVSHAFAFSIGYCLLIMLGIPHTWWLVAYPLYAVLVLLITIPSYYLTEEPFLRLREGTTRSLLRALPQALATALKRPTRSEADRPSA